MPKHRDYDDGNIFHASFTDALQEFLSGLGEFRLTRLNGTTVRVVASTGNSLVAMEINGRWRYRTSNYDLDVSGGGSATKDIHVVAVTENDFTGAGNDPDETDYNWELRVVASGGTPSSVAAYRKVGEVDWNGSAITALRQTVGSVAGAQIETAAIGATTPIAITRGADGSFTIALDTDMATQAELEAHAADESGVHGIADMSDVVLTDDSRLTDERVPTDGSVELDKLATAVARALVPVGTILPYGGSSAPSGYVLCNGASLARAGTYADLFGVLGTAFGSADGSHFNVPDLRGRVPVGVDGTANRVTIDDSALGQSGGEEDHQLTEAELANHDHTHPSGFLPASIASISSGGGAQNCIQSANTMSIAPSGGDDAHNNLQPYQITEYIIKY